MSHPGLTFTQRGAKMLIQHLHDLPGGDTVLVLDSRDISKCNCGTGICDAHNGEHEDKHDNYSDGTKPDNGIKAGEDRCVLHSGQEGSNNMFQD